MRLLPILLVMISALASYGQVDAQVRPLEPPREAGSKWSIVRTKDGEELSRTLVNRTFDFAFRYINGRETDLLFSQEVRTTYKLSEEGDNGRVRIEAWASVRPDTGYRRKLWNAELPGSAARLLEDYYEVTTTGCCGTWDARTYLSVATGHAVVSFTNGPVALRGGDIGEPNAQEPINVVYLSSMGAQASAALRSDSTAFGEIDLVQGDSILSRVVLSALDRKADPMASAEFAVLAGSESASEGALYIAQGRRAVVRISTDATAPISIPIVGKSFTLVGASVPTAVRARMVK